MPRNCAQYVGFRGVELHAAHGVHYRDAQILATARLNGCGAVLTEDIASPALAGIRFANPFVEGFDLREAVG
ncbi:MAG: hypothetical protein IBX62_04265 [Coriobacteriia bacterium]|nr:hypothetical protein [Coriobacteriia bacterium]